MYGTAEQVGQELVCPDCGTRAIVRPLAAEPVGTAGQQEMPPVREEYGILEGVIQPAPDSPLVNQVYIPVICEVCKTRMLATPEQVGQELVCPDCQTRCRVRPPAERAAAAEEMPMPREGPDAEYKLAAGVDQPAPGSEAYAEHVGLYCPVCHTRLHFTLDQVGQTAVCPDCRVPLVVPPPKPKPRAYRDEEQGPADYDVGQAPQRTSTPVSGRPRKIDRRYLVPTADRPSLPPHPFLTGVPRFPFYRGVLIRWLAFWLTALPIAALGRFAAEIAMQGYGAMVGVPLLAATGFFAAWWIAALGASFLAIVNETASGNDQIQVWPELSFIDSIFEAAFVVNSMAVAAVPGAGVAWLDPGHGPLYVGISIFAGFPVVFLSMLERDSCMLPWSPAVLQSLWTGRRVWTIFYLETTVAITAAVGLTMELPFPPVEAILWTIPLDLVVMTVYARLLGRLGWCLQEQWESGWDSV
jgi:DNA-directed RNA polymerase subunit RPC12/RpoP